MVQENGSILNFDDASSSVSLQTNVWFVLRSTTRWIGRGVVLYLARFHLPFVLLIIRHLLFPLPSHTAVARVIGVSLHIFWKRLNFSCLPQARWCCTIHLDTCRFRSLRSFVTISFTVVSLFLQNYCHISILSKGMILQGLPFPTRCSTAPYSRIFAMLYCTVWVKLLLWRNVTYWVDEITMKNSKTKSLRKRRRSCFRRMWFLVKTRESILMLHKLCAFLFVYFWFKIASIHTECSSKCFISICESLSLLYIVYLSRARNFFPTVSYQWFFWNCGKHL